jgi:hypothetical protein
LPARAEKNAADFEAQQMEMKAKEEPLPAQRDALAKRKEGAIVNSRAQALAAASGGGAGTDAPTIVKLMSDTAGEATTTRRPPCMAAIRARRGSGTAPRGAERRQGIFARLGL